MTGLATSSAAATAPDAPHRDSGSENFPVGSRLLPARTRGHVLTFYRFARAADDIADASHVPADDKDEALCGILAALDGKAPRGHAEHAAAELRTSLEQTGVTDRHARDLIAAFRRDARNPRCADWDDLMDYCRLSAASVGRHLIDLHGEDQAAYPCSDALCSALQILNHLQDCGDDFVELDRVYLPLDWMRAEGAGLQDLAGAAATPSLRRVLDRCLDATAPLIDEARRLPAALGRSRLRWEASVIVVVAERLARRLRRQDPLGGRVALGRVERLGCLATGVMRAAAMP